MRLYSLLLASTVFFAACSGSGQLATPGQYRELAHPAKAHDSGTEPIDGAESKLAAEPADATEASVTRTGYEDLSRPFDHLGTACARSDRSIRCLDGRVVVVRTLWDIAPRPSKATVLVDDGDSASVNMTSLFLAIDGTVLWARALTCGVCRRQVGWALVADVSQLDSFANTELAAEVLGSRKAPPKGRTEWIRRIKADAQAGILKAASKRHEESLAKRSRCRQDFDCVLSTFSSCCDSCPFETYATNKTAVTKDKARCASVDCPLSATCSRSPHPSNAFKAVCRSTRCVLERK